LDYLRHEPVTNVHALRRQRITLRTVATAAENGLVDVDLESGRVAVRRP
jgi:hypothetical protein